MFNRWPNVVMKKHQRTKYSTCRPLDDIATSTAHELRNRKGDAKKNRVIRDFSISTAEVTVCCYSKTKIIRFQKSMRIKKKSWSGSAVIGEILLRVPNMILAERGWMWANIVRAYSVDIGCLTID